jgi:hypothetical protein
MTPEELQAHIYSEIVKRIQPIGKLEDWSKANESIMKQILEGISVGIITADNVNSMITKNKINEVIMVINHLVNYIIPLIIPPNDEKYYLLQEYMRDLKNALMQYNSTFPWITNI